VRRYDGKNWAALFNTSNGPDGQRLADKMYGLIHKAADRVQSWPNTDRFPQLL
jgi:hypothetical protein